MKAALALSLLAVLILPGCGPKPTDGAAGTPATATGTPTDDLRPANPSVD